MECDFQDSETVGGVLPIITSRSLQLHKGSSSLQNTFGFDKVFQRMLPCSRPFI